MAILKAKPFNNSRRLEKMQCEISNPRSTKMLNAELDSELLKRFKMRSVSDNIPMTVILTELITKFLDETK